MLSMSFSPESMKEIVAFAGFGTLLSEEVQKALKEGGQIIIDAAVANTWERFKAPTGQLASSLGIVTDSMFEIEIGSDLPYAARMQWGFVGTDSLGRTYNQQGTFYLSDALDQNQQEVLQLIDDAVERALERIAG